MEIRRPTWPPNMRSKIWVNVPANFTTDEDGVPVTCEPATELLGATDEFKQRMMTMLGVPKGYVVSPQGELVKATDPEPTPMEVESPASPPREAEASETSSYDLISDALADKLVQTTADDIWDRVGEARKKIKQFVDERAADFVDKESGTNFAEILRFRGDDLDVADVFALLQGVSVKIECYAHRLELRPVAGRAFISAKTGRALTKFLTAIYWSYNRCGECGNWADLYPQRLRVGAENNCWVDQK